MAARKRSRSSSGIRENFTVESCWNWERVGPTLTQTPAIPIRRLRGRLALGGQALTARSRCRVSGDYGRTAESRPRSAETAKAERMKVHRRISPPITVHPVLAGPVLSVHACIKTTRFCGQVGPGDNAARRASAHLSGGSEQTPGRPLARVSSTATGLPHADARVRRHKPSAERSEGA